jgi:NAD(P)-dependent dehydrogenase (short-subunit alcohol dehydrogenase family)
MNSFDMTLNIDLSNYRAIVTGVSSGIGAGIADMLAQAGCDLAGCGLDSADSEEAKRFVATVERHGRSAFYQSLDISDAKSARAFVDRAATQLGGLDVLVSNAGRNFFKGVEKATDTDWESNINLNLAAHWRVTQAAKPYLDQSPAPVIIMITSNHALYTLPNSFPYNVAKAGLVAMVQSLAIEWGPHIRAVGIAPGFIDTPITEAWFNGFPDPEAKRKEIEGLHPVGRLGTPYDVGALCVFLCSPLAGNISGNTILIDGGRSAVMQDV